MPVFRTQPTTERSVLSEPYSVLRQDLTSSLITTMIGHRVATDRHQDMLALFQEGETTGYRLQGYLAFGVLASPLADSHFQRLVSFSDATLHAPERSTLYLNVAASCSQALRGLATGL